MNETDSAREYLRAAFMAGRLDLTDSYERLLGFVKIFKGEPEAVIAITESPFLTDYQFKKLKEIAAVTTGTQFKLQNWQAAAFYPQ